MGKRICTHCKGIGKHQVSDVDWDDCRSCNGTGYKEILITPPSDQVKEIEGKTAEEILKSKFIVDGKPYYEWPNIRNRNDIFPKIIGAMQEYADLQTATLRDQTIQQCIDKFKDTGAKGCETFEDYKEKVLEELSKLKSEKLGG